MDLVLLPGMNCSPALWSSVMPHLPSPVRVHSPHLDGAQLDCCVDALLDTLPPRFALAGLSLGGIVAMALARRAPERVQGLALLDTNPRPPTDAQRDGWEATIDSVRSGVSAQQVQRDLLPVLLSQRGREDADIVSATLAMARDVGDDRLLDQLRLQGTRQDERPGLAALRVPTLALCGSADALCPVERHEEIAGSVPDAELAVIPGAGHLTPLEAPEAVTDALTRWLNRI